MTKKRVHKFVLRFTDVGMKDVPLVGGKNASLGEMIRELKPKGIKLPGGFIVTADAYQYFIDSTGLRAFIQAQLKGLDTHDVDDLARRGKAIREAMKRHELPKDLKQEIINSYRQLEKEYGRNVDVAVRSSATAEDLPTASFAGQHETYLNIRGAQDLLKAVRSSMASLFTNRAISYREDKGFDHLEVALSVGVQKMVRADTGVAGVLFTLDTESGFPNVVLISGSWGLGELIVRGEVTPDEFWVFKKTLVPPRKQCVPIISKQLGIKDKKVVYSSRSGIKGTKIVQTSRKEKEIFVLSEQEVLTLARWGVLIEEHYSKKHGKWMPMDIEWAKDGRTGELFIVQARPETVHATRDLSKISEYARTEDGKVLVKGASVGSKIIVGKAHVILDVKDMSSFRRGEVLITDMTDPDWEPIMKIASAIVTDKGSRTSHAAIVSRELGVPCIVGAGNATSKIKTGQTITIDTTGSDGLVFAGVLKFRVREYNIGAIPKPKTKIMMNIATPETAFEKSFFPNEGVGLAREEFIIASDIGVHPLALIHFKSLPQKLKKVIEKKTVGWNNKRQFYVDKLAYGIAMIGAAFYSKEVIVRFSDFKTNEYRSLLGGELYEPEEENPMLGWRGASRYYDEKFKDAFVLECLAMKKARDEMGLKNIVPMLPFCRTVEEGKKVLEIMVQNGLDRKKDRTLKVYVMCEIPSNVVLAEEFLKIFDGMSIGSNDLTQLVLGLDRDSGIVADVGNENNPAVRRMVSDVIAVCRKRKKYIGICGQAPSDYPEFAEFLVEQGIESISLNPDSIIPTTLRVYKKEKKLRTKKRKI